MAWTHCLGVVPDGIDAGEQAPVHAVSRHLERAANSAFGGSSDPDPLCRMSVWLLAMDVALVA